MTGVPGDPNQRQISITRNHTNNLPTPYTYEYGGTYQASPGQLCLNHSSLQSLPQSSPKETSTMAPQIGPQGLQENSISHEDWSVSQH